MGVPNEWVNKMKMMKLWVIAIAAVLLLACMPVSAASSHVWNGTEANARYNVGVFMNDKAYDQMYVTKGWITFSNDTRPGPVTDYVVRMKNSTFYVNKENGVVESVEFRDAMVSPSPAENKTSRYYLLAKSVRYAGQKSDDFSKKSWTLVVDKTAVCSPDGFQGYVFGFREKNQPHVIIIGFNPYTGEIIKYENLQRTPEEDPSFSTWLDHINEKIT
jgi:ABC-type oligopeptide transport system substrate-binding subunit